ncbi:hypothetical protein [uncultured Vibrio sp.]|uniref:hypothetical protein n=1 Tax=uncultured Vibrio sp. TaxID=114054 RepID=UPI00260D5625|nr:hypothetical protein [uncultured Vibrio sp.]
MKLNKTIVSFFILTSSLGAHAEINYKLTVNLPATSGAINQAISEGLDITLEGTKLDDHTGIEYGLLSFVNSEKYCYFYNKELVSRYDSDFVFSTLREGEETVIDYGWPFESLPPIERFANYSDGSAGDIVTGQVSSGGVPFPALVVCRDLITPTPTQSLTY